MLQRNVLLNNFKKGVRDKNFFTSDDNDWFKNLFISKLISINITNNLKLYHYNLNISNWKGDRFNYIQRWGLIFGADFATLKILISEYNWLNEKYANFQQRRSLLYDFSLFAPSKILLFEIYKSLFTMIHEYLQT